MNSFKSETEVTFNFRRAFLNALNRAGVLPMPTAALVLIAALAAAPAAGPDPPALVAKLGSAEPAERAAAVESLKVGSARACRRCRPCKQPPGADDTDLRGRASALWETDPCRDLMTRPSLVRLDFKDLPLADVIDDLRKQTGLALRASQVSREGPVNVREPARRSRSGRRSKRLGLKAVPGSTSITRERRGSRTSTRSNNPEWVFTTSSGPFRVALTGLHLHRDRQLIRGPWVRIDRFGQRISVPTEDATGETITFFGGLDVMVEPRMWFTQEAPARLTEASDDLGQSLIPETGGREAKLNDGAHFAFFAGSGVTKATTEFRLRSPESCPGRLICSAPRGRPRDAPPPPARPRTRHPAGRRRR